METLKGSTISSFGGQREVQCVYLGTTGNEASRGSCRVQTVKSPLQGVVLWFQSDGSVLREVAKHF